MKDNLRYIFGICLVAFALYCLVLALQNSENSDGPQESIVTKEYGPENGRSAMQYGDVPISSMNEEDPHETEPQAAADLMRNSRDYRVVFELLTRAGTMEARFYSKDILRYCFAIRKLGLRQVEILSSPQDSARELLQARCSSFSDDELSFDALRKIDSDTRYPPGLAELNQAWLEAAGDETKQKEVFGEILRSNDALILQHVGASLLGRYRESVQLNGTRFQGSEALNSVRMAWIAAVCEATRTNCGTGDSYVVEICANMNICESSRTRALRALLARESGQEQLGTFDIAHAIFVKAIQARDIELFFPQAQF